MYAPSSHEEAEVFQMRVLIAYEDYPEFGGALLTHFNDIDEARKAAEEEYCGCYTSLADYVQDLRLALAGFASMRVHGLKHTCGRRLRAAGVTEEDRKALLGHKNGSITSHYSGAELGKLIDEANKISATDSRGPALTILRRKAG